MRVIGGRNQEVPPVDSTLSIGTFMARTSELSHGEHQLSLVAGAGSASRKRVNVTIKREVSSDQIGSEETRDSEAQYGTK
jgi:hypothetical protein